MYHYVIIPKMHTRGSVAHACHECEKEVTLLVSQNHDLLMIKFQTLCASILSLRNIAMFQFSKEPMLWHTTLPKPRLLVLSWSFPHSLEQSVVVGCSVVPSILSITYNIYSRFVMRTSKQKTCDFHSPQLHYNGHRVSSSAKGMFLLLRLNFVGNIKH